MFLLQMKTILHWKTTSVEIGKYSLVVFVITLVWLSHNHNHTNHTKMTLTEDFSEASTTLQPIRRPRHSIMRLLHEVDARIVESLQLQDHKITNEEHEESEHSDNLESLVREL